MADARLRLGIDFGTTTTVAMLAGPDGRIRPLTFDASPLLASGVFAAPDGVLLTGADAARAAVASPGGYEAAPKRLVDDGTAWLGDQEHAVADLFAGVLRTVMAEARRVAGGPPDEIVLTHPAGWGRARLGVLAEAADRAGLGSVAFVTEPVAAAAYFVTVLGQRFAPGRNLVIYDLGAGTFDVSVVRLTPTGSTVLASGGIDVGGRDFDAAVVEIARASTDAPDAWGRLDWPQTVAEQQARHALWQGARAAKELLSRHARADLRLPQAGIDVHVTRDEFDAAARPLLDRTVDLTLTMLREAGVAPEAVAGVVLVGGSSRIPLVGTLLHRRLRIAPTVIDQPELVVAEGSLHADLHGLPTDASGSGASGSGASGSGASGSDASGPDASGSDASGPDARRTDVNRTDTGPADAGVPVVSPTAARHGGDTGGADPATPESTASGAASPGVTAVAEPEPPPIRLPDLRRYHTVPAVQRDDAWRAPHTVAAVVLVLVTVVLAAVALGGADDLVAARDTPADPTLSLLTGLGGFTDAVECVRFSPDGRFVAGSADDGTVRVWETATRRELPTMRGHQGKVIDIKFTPDSRGLVSGGTDNTVRQWDVETGRETGKLTGAPDAAAFPPVLAFVDGGSTLAVAGARGDVRLRDLGGGPDRGLLDTTTDTTVFGVALSVDGRLFATGRGDHGIVVWDLASRKPQATLRGHTKRVYEVMFHPKDDDLLASSSEDGTVRLWRISTGTQLRTFEDDGKPTTNVAFSPDGTFLASGDYAGGVRLWDVATGRLIEKLTGQDIVASVAFSPDGKLLAVAGVRRTIELWRIERR